MSGKGILGTLEGLGLIETTDSPSEPAASDAPSAAFPPTAPAAIAPGAPATASADPNMVAKIMAAVTAATHAPRLTSFLANLETAKQAFPNDQRSAVSAALAFSKLTSNDIRDELTKAVAAALLEAENKIKGDISHQREQVAIELDSEAEGHRRTIASLEEQIRGLQGQLGTAQAALSKIDSTRSHRTAAISGSESTALASLAAVKTELSSISAMLP